MRSDSESLKMSADTEKIVAAICIADTQNQNFIYFTQVVAVQTTHSTVVFEHENNILYDIVLQG